MAAEEAEESAHWANDAKIWATGEDAEVEELESGEHSARIYSELAKAGAIRAEEAEGRIGDVAHLSNDETFTGQKTFEQTVNSKGFYICRTEVPYTETPSATIEKGFLIRDKNNTTFASLLSTQYASGTNRIQMQVKGKAEVSRVMYVQENADGAVTYSYGQKIGSNYIAIPRDAGNYVQYCWGSGSKASGNTFTFPSAFNSAPVVVAVIGPEDGGSTINVVVSSITKTGFKVVHNAPAGDLNKNVSYIAIGTADM